MAEANSTEVWLPVSGFEEHYSVSNLGRVRRDKGGHGCKAGLVLKANKHTKRGGLSVNLCVESKQHTRLIHRLVAAAFIGPRPEGQEINHLDGNKANNVVSNLEYCTQEENMRHAVENGLTSHGETHPSAKLTSEKVRNIRRLISEGVPCEHIGSLFGISGHAVGDIKRGVTWKSVV